MIRLNRVVFPTDACFSRVVKNGSVVSILIVKTKRGGDREKTGGVSSEIRGGFFRGLQRSCSETSEMRNRKSVFTPPVRAKSLRGIGESPIVHSEGFLDKGSDVCA